MNNIFVKLKLVKNRGSALITSLLVMGILGAVALATMALVMKEIMITGLVIDSGKAYYAAESGVELSLLDLKKHLAGFDGGKDGEVLGANYSYKISNKSNQYPYVPEGEYSDVDLVAHPEVLYASLGLNESVTIPLFTVAPGDEEGKVTNFRVQFFVKFNSEDLKYTGGTVPLSEWDVLRWKIHGIKENAVGNDEFGTESINDFTAVSTIAETKENTSASDPTWFGSVSCDERSYNLRPGIITCHPYRPLPPQADREEINGQYIYTKICAQTEAREYYAYKADNKSSDVVACYPINQFLTEHKYNYLTLTNLMNPNVFKDKTDVEVEKLSRIYYRIEAYDGEMVREYANIVSTGKSGDSEIILNVQKKKDSYIPVLNFALYHTK